MLGYNPDVLVLSKPPAGGWLAGTVSPNAVEAAGTTFYGYVRGDNGNVEMRSYDPATKTTSAVFVLHAAFSQDIHACPAILVRPSDSKLLAVYAYQGATSLFARISTNALDVSAWGTEFTITPAVSAYLYPNLIKLASGTIWCIYKEQDTTWSSITSTDGGATWSGRTQVWSATGDNTYGVFWSTGGTRIDCAFVDNTPTVVTTNNLYHFYMDGGTWHKSDGTSLTPPATPSNSTLVRNGTAVFPIAASYNASGHPAIGVEQYDLASATYQDCRWSGSAWVTSSITTSAPSYFNRAPPGMAYLDGGADTVYLGKDVDVNVFEMFRYTTADDGATWTKAAQVTQHSGQLYFNNTPVAVRGASAGPKVLWATGPMGFDYVYSRGVSGT